MKKQRKGRNAKTAKEIHQCITDFEVWVRTWKYAAYVEVVTRINSQLLVDGEAFVYLDKQPPKPNQ